MADYHHWRRAHRTLGAYRLRLLNVARSYATYALVVSAGRLRDLLWDSLRVATHNERTKQRWCTEDRRWAYAFVATMNELDRPRLINTIHTCIIQSEPMVGEWAHDSGPALARDSVTFRASHFPRPPFLPAPVLRSLARHSERH